MSLYNCRRLPDLAGACNIMFSICGTNTVWEIPPGLELTLNFSPILHFRYWHELIFQLILDSIAGVLDDVVDC